MAEADFKRTHNKFAFCLACNKLNRALMKYRNEATRIESVGFVPQDLFGFEVVEPPNVETKHEDIKIAKRKKKKSRK